MIKTPPTTARIAAMVFFTLSCFGILLYLWTTFGGPVPLKAKGYRFYADFKEATQLADNAAVRISGVPVGRVVGSVQHGDATRATIEMNPRYAPIPRDTRAILRFKTLLGETYVELTPGNRASGRLPDGGVLPDTQVRDTVELDEVLRVFDPRTRRAFRTWLQSMAGAVKQRGQDFNEALANLDPFAQESTQLLSVLDSQHDAVRQLVRDTGVVFDSLAARDHELTALISAGDRVLATTAHRNRELEQTIKILPTTLRELRPTLDQVAAASRDAAPLVRDLHPGARALEPALRNTVALAPQLRGMFAALDPVITASRIGLPATERTLRASQPLFQILEPVLRELGPVVDFLGLYKQELPAQLAGLSAATEATKKGANGVPIHYLRSLVPFTSESQVVAARRNGSNRHNPYWNPRALDRLLQGLEAFDCRNAGNSFKPDPAPPCKVQSPLRFEGRRLAYPHVTRAR